MKTLQILTALTFAVILSAGCSAMNPIFNVFLNTSIENDADLVDYELKSKITYWIMKLTAYEQCGIHAVPQNFQAIVTNLFQQYTIEELLIRFKSLNALEDQELITFVNDPINNTL